MPDPIVVESDNMAIAEGFGEWMVQSGTGARSTEEKARELAQAFAQGWMRGAIHAVGKLAEQGDPRAMAALIATARNEVRADDGERRREVTVAASLDPEDAEAFGMALDQLAEDAQRMAIDPDGIVKPVSKFADDEVWWCDCEDAEGPHVHCQMHIHAVDLITGHSERHPEYGKREARDA